ncbi:hypothetical protein FHS74_005003 [Nitrospirillum iridis]|uniref:Uncharacterized protein n=1 Tax=Nitrospirillum iridis TaxID=765888 RepID=A0A7X0EHA0_9PROT|nr:hypothetical protein [Nitrospirillum iridis]
MLHGTILVMARADKEWNTASDQEHRILYVKYR